MHKLVYRSALALTSLAALVLVPVASAQAASPIGIDLSWPQCSGSAVGAHPDDFAFLVAGLNHGLANNDNGCFGSELALGTNSANGSTAQPKASIYLNTGNPGLAGSWWPNSNKTQDAALTVPSLHGTCAHTASSACAYVYGYSMAHYDVDGVRTGNAVANPTAYRWWLDVETNNTWSSNTTMNTAAIEGWTDFLASRGISTGLYSTASQWKAIAGSTSATASIAGLPSWIAGSTSTGAANVCTAAGLTPGGVVTLVQYVSASIDYDLFCAPMIASAPVITGTPTLGHTITSTAGTWQSGVTLHDQWKRNGVAIRGATTHRYTVTSADAGKSITMTITATGPGFATTTRTSTAVRAGHALTATPTPTLGGSTVAGHPLAATAHSWAPSPVTLHYQWARNGVAIAGATASRYTLTGADVGQSITVVVTGSKSGYVTVSKSSAARIVRAA